DQKHSDQDVKKGIDLLLADQPGRAFITSKVTCLFARSVYTNEQLAECLAVSGYQTLADSIEETAEYIRTLRWKVRISTGFNPDNIAIPRRFYEVKTWKGRIDGSYLDQVKKEYGRRIMALAGSDN
ncbi:MAG: aldehyde ferredoxin oxidoreductase, partial [Deltaproteobacteria bacterium]|nr:aldehyde ferredoxin oxidoreductase [Deltaproteobacteria bacterium]